MIEFVTRMLDKGQLSADRYKRLNMHRLSGGKALDALEASTKLNAEWDFLIYMRDLGRAEAERWLEAHFADIGERSTLDLKGMLS
jgi:NTE family protein